MPSIWADTLGEHRALVRQRLLDAFADLVQERGLEQTTLAAVAERAGIARSAVYNHVADKHELILAHAEQVLGVAAEHLGRALPPDLPAAERLAIYVQATFRSFAVEPAAVADVMGLLDPDQQQRLLGYLQPLRALLEQIVRDGVDEGTFRGDAEDLTRFVWATLSGYRSAWQRVEIDADEGAAVCTRLLLGGLAGTAGT